MSMMRVCVTSTDCQRRQRMCAGVRERVHQLHHVGGERTLPPGEEEDHQRGGHPVCHVHAGLRHVRGAAEALPAEVQRGETQSRHVSLDLTITFPFRKYTLKLTKVDVDDALPDPFDPFQSNNGSKITTAEKVVSRQCNTEFG